MNSIKTDILIIGAGLTGLTLAYYLKKEAITFKIIEAKHTIGGRINTVYNENHAPIELGATWMIDQQIKVLKLLKDLKVLIFEQYYGNTAIYHPQHLKEAQLVKLPENNAKSYRIANGTYSIIEALTKHIPKESIDCNQIATSISQFPEGIHIITKTAKYQCKHVVSTLPPLLFSKHISVDPKLPSELFAIMANTHTWMHNAIRIGFTYKSPFWNAKNTSGTIYSSHGPIQEFYDHSNVENELYALSGFLNSSFTEKTKEERKTLALKQLQQYYGDIALDFESYEECVWNNEVYTSVASDRFLMPQTNNGHSYYKNAYLNDRLYFAGAETSVIFPGKMEGAIQSAEFVFHQLKQRYN